MCKIICTRSQYHSLQQGNGNFVNSAEIVAGVAAGATQLFTMPENCALLGVYYNADPATQEWKYIDYNGNADIAISNPFPHSFVQSEIKNRASGETNINTSLNVNLNLFSRFVDCNFVAQVQKNVSVTNNTAGVLSITIVYVCYNWILAKD